ncbi:uncharacterized protein LOC126891582 [Diabrotica virgifera virgifera]|uniref:Uncharacterized protein n=1 Tax=Diabrotica virgifera virgifera TaxID=50390 RepID=A0ABM5L2Q8_DIAVI|nr:uncharacterized protein LOC126891582 [Diabrotica virgifera virgifera]
MENLCRPPEPLTLDGNIAANWKRFSQKFELFMTATGLLDKPEAQKIAVFLNLVGDEGLDLHNSFTYTEEEEKKLESIIKKFEDYCSPTANLKFERFKFNSVMQAEAQTFDYFLTELRKAVKTTSYQDQDEMVRDRIVMSIWDKNTQEKLLREPKLTLTKAIEFCRAVEVSKSQSKALQSELGVNVLRSKPSSSSTPNLNQSSCHRCGYKHKKNAICPAIGKSCAKCQKPNHFASVCKHDEKKKEKNRSWKQKNVHLVEKEDNSSDSDSVCDVHFLSSINVIDSVDSTRRKSESVWMQKINIGHSHVEFKLDTGAEGRWLAWIVIHYGSYMHRNNVM